MSDFRLDAAAGHDLDDIFDYIAQQNQSAAIKFTRRLRDAMRLLALQPETGERRPELGPNLRSFSVGSHVIFFCPEPDGIAVVRVLHGARDYGPGDLVRMP